MSRSRDCIDPLELERAHDEGRTFEHLATCASCAASWHRLDELSAAVGELPWTPPDELQTRRVRTRVLDANQPSARPARWRTLIPTIAFGLATAAAATVATWWVARSADDAAPPLTSVAVATPVAAPIAPPPPSSAPRVTVTDTGETLQLTINTGESEFEVHSTAIASAAPARGVKLRVTRGQIKVLSSSETKTLGPDVQWTTLAGPTPMPSPALAPATPVVAPPPRSPPSTARTAGDPPRAARPPVQELPVAPPAAADPPSATIAREQVQVAAPAVDVVKTATAAETRIDRAAGIHERQEIKRDRLERTQDRGERKQDRLERRLDRLERKEDRAEQREQRRSLRSR